MLHIYFDLRCCTLIWTAVGRRAPPIWGDTDEPASEKGKNDFCRGFFGQIKKKIKSKGAVWLQKFKRGQTRRIIRLCAKFFRRKCLEEKLLRGEIIVLLIWLFWKHVTQWAFLIPFNSLTDYFCTAHFKWTLVELPQFVLRRERKGKTLGINDLHGGKVVLTRPPPPRVTRKVISLINKGGFQVAFKLSLMSRSKRRRI